MASSDEEGEIVPVCVTNYQFMNNRDAPTSFSELPLVWSDQEKLIENGDSSVVYLRGNSDGGLQSVYKEVIAWKLELSHVEPQVQILSKGKTWIQLQKPRKSYENVIKSVLIVVRCLHFAKRNPDATRDQISSHLVKTLSSYDLVEPVDTYLSAHLPLIQSAMTMHKDLAKSKYLKSFLMEIENPGRKEYHLEGNQTKNKAKFIVSDSDDENEENDEHDEDDDDEDELLFDSVCAYCDNGGDVLPCEGQCMRSFHPTIESGVDTNCESLGFANAAQYEAIATFLCANCRHHKHQCFACGRLGCSDKSSSTIEVFPCVNATCGHFYHPECVSKLLHPLNETLAKKLERQIASGESFTCPVHNCRVCKQGEDKEVHELQFAVCRRCPKAYHRKCLPSKIGLHASDDGLIKQRAWDDLLPKRILMYCMKHPVLPELGTPKRDHLLFPCFIRKEGSRIMSERISKSFGNLTNTSNIPKVVERRLNTVTKSDTKLEKGKSSIIQEKRPSIEKNAQTSRISEPSTILQKKSTYKDIQREQSFPSKKVKKIIVDSPVEADADMKNRILKLIKDSTASFDTEEFIKEKRRKCTHQIYSPQIGLDKTITMGKVEASVKAVRTALKTLEDGGSVEDAKAVCEPNVLNQLVKWKAKLHVFLAPFLHGARYTSFGRHFTKVDKLKEIVERLHWYVKDGDTIVDFCCGSNDFSCFMKEKLDSTGKKCFFKNYDLITPKNTFEFEKRDWFSVPVEDLPDGSRLVMGLNPPFGVQASLANKFINHALKFKPKLLILIAPKETKRIDERKWDTYDLIWEEEDMLSGKSFYLPGSVDAQDRQIEDWNVVSPPLSLWSRPDFTSQHKSIAQQQNHIKQNQIYENPVSRKQKRTKHKKHGKRRVWSYLMDENLDCYNDFSNMATKYPDISNILDDVPEEEPKDTNTVDDVAEVDMDLCNPVVSPRRVPDTGPYYDPFTDVNTNVLPYESGVVGFQYGFPSHPGGSSISQYGQGHFAMQPPPYANYDPFTDVNTGVPTMPTLSYEAGTFPPGYAPNYHQLLHYPSETNIWPPGTFPPDPRFG